MSIFEELQMGQGSITDQVSESAKRKGVFLAQVTNITDPDKLNRVKCKLITTDADVLETDWCYVMSPLGGAAYGQFFMPNVDDYVILTYINGEEQRPLVLGCCWNATATAPYTLEDGKNFNYSIKTPGTSELLFYDEKDKEKITLNTPKAASLVMSDEAQEICLSDPDDKNKVYLSWKSGEMEIKAEKKITLTVGSNSVAIDSEGNIKISSQKELAMDSVTISAKATNQLTGEGATTEIKATGQLTLQSSGTADLKGSMVNIN